MEFYSRTNRPATIPYPKSDKIIPTYSLQINLETGKKELKETGKTNIYEMIQASKEETLIYNILKRFQEGDIEALNKTQGIYGDFTNMPRTLAEAQQLLIDTEKSFNNLPIEIRREFNMSTSEYLASLSNGKFETVMEKYKKEPKVQQPIEQPTEQQVQQTIEHQVQGGLRYE